MPTPSIQTLTTDAQQVLNLDSISAVRSVVAVALANANTGTPLNPNLTTQQLWDQFYQVVTRPKSDIESIIANQLMKFLYSPPAPGGAGADKQVIFNDGGVLAGDADFLWNKTTNLLTVTGSATITGAASVGTTLSVTGVSTFAAGTALLPALTTTGDANTGIYYPAADTFAVTTGGSERFRIDSSGNVGIGVTPSAWSATFRSLDIGSGTLTSQPSQQTIGLYANAFENGTNYTRKALGFAAAYNIYNGAHYWLNAASGAAGSTFAFGSAVMTLDASGNLGLGVTPSAWATTFNVKAFQTAGGSLFNFSNTVISLTQNSFYNTSGGYSYANNGFASEYYQMDGKHIWRTAASGTAGNAVTFTQAMTLDASGNLLVGVTSANASGGCLQLKSGITFPATQVASSDANTLDDYEEGTWTPTFTFTTPGTLAVSYADRLGSYTKVGRLVTVRFQITIAPSGFVKGTANGQFQITGLPFALGSNSSGAQYFDLAASLADQSSGSLIFGYGQTGLSALYFERVSVSGTRVIRDNGAVTDANFAATNAGYISISAVVTYTV